MLAGVYFVTSLCGNTKKHTPCYCLEGQRGVQRPHKEVGAAQPRLLQ
jgi:hypothetical protein